MQVFPSLVATVEDRDEETPVCSYTEPPTFDFFLSEGR